MWDKQNGPIVRTGYLVRSNTTAQVVLDASTSDISLENINGVLMVQAADGTMTAIAGVRSVQVLSADLVVTGTLAAYVYANGTAGVGATLTANANGAFATQDSVASAAGLYYLVPPSMVADAAYAGLYKLTTRGTAGTKAVLTRAAEFDTAADMVDGTLFSIRQGTLYGNKGAWELTVAVTTVGTDPVMISRAPNVALLDTAQTFTAAHTFAALTLKVNNATDTNAHTFASNASAARTATLPDQDGTAVMVTTAPTTAGQIPRASGAGAHTSSTATYPDTATQGDIMVATAANVYGSLAAGAAGTVLRGAGAGVVPAYSTATYPDTVVQGDILVATAANVLGAVADVAVGQVLASGGVGAVPAYTPNPSLASLTLSTGLTLSDGSLVSRQGAGTGTGDVIERIGATATEGLELRVYEDTVSPNAIETNLINVPARSVIVAVQANCQATLTGGGTTVTWSIGTSATPDKYGTAGNGAGNTLVQNGKLDFIPAWAQLTSAEQLVLTGCAAGGAADGDTALTVGSVRVRVVYYALNSLDDA